MKKNNLKINLGLFLYIFLSLVILINDYFTYFLNIKYIIGIIISFIIIFLISLFLIKKEIIEINNNFSKFDFIFFSLILLLFIITFVYPDRSFDTINYHLYLQEHPFGDKIFKDFFPAKNINSFTYAFTDRFTYLFRFIFGYRVGIIFNYFVITAIYYEIKKILKETIKTKEIFLVLLTIISTITLCSIDLMDSYYVDLISIVYVLEIFYLTFYNKFNNSNIIFIGLLCGFYFVSKISNAFIIILLFIFYLILHFKEIKKEINLKSIIITILLFIFPFILYMFYTFISTGNPFFPFYNKIFKSKFYKKTNWLDYRFGPKSIIEILFWPIYIFICPDRFVDTGIVEYTWAIGYVIVLIKSIIIIFNRIKNKKAISNYNYIYIFTLFAFIVWCKFMLGYTRYGLSVLYFSLICIANVIYELSKYKNKILLIILIIIICLNIINQFYLYFHFSYSWTFSNYFSKDYKSKKIRYRTNLKKIFKDRNIDIDFDDNSVIGISYFNSGFATLINNTNNFISLTDGVSNKYTKEILNNSLNNKKIYALIDTVDFENCIDLFNKKGYLITNISEVIEPDFLDNVNKLYILEVERSKKKQNNYKEIVGNVDLKIDKSGKYNISFIGGPGKYMRNIDSSNYYLKLSKCNKNKCEDLENKNIKSQKMYSFNSKVELKDNEKIYIKLTDTNNNDIDSYAVGIVNLKIKEVK